MSLRTLILALFSAFVAISLLAVGLIAHNAWRDYGNASLVSDANPISDLLLVSGGAWAVERGMTNALLSNPEPAAPAALEKLLERRAKADTAYDDALALVHESADFEAKDTLVSNLAAAYAAAQKARAQVDIDIRRPLDARDAAFRPTWVPTMTKLIIASQDLRYLVAEAGDSAASRLYRMKGLRHFAWLMSEYAGRERAVLAGIISTGRPLTYKDIEKLGAFRGHVEAGWEMIGKFMLTGDMPPSVRAAYEEVKTTFAGDFEKLRHNVYKTGEAGEPYPVDEFEWFERATAAIDTLLALQTAATGAMHERVGAIIGWAQFEMFGTFALIILTVGLGVFGITLVVRRIISPIVGMTTSMTALSDGNYETEVPETRYEDEVGAMARALAVFKQALIDKRAADEAAARENEAKARRAAELDQLTKAFEAEIGAMVETLTSAASQLEAAAQSMSSTAERTDTQALAVSSASEQASANVQTVASASEELSASIGEISQQVSRSSAIAGQAATDAERTNSQIQGLAEAAQKIGEVVDLINDIANQTNLLALNATIEAARAGEAGKGFAVVASEVKNLAMQTAKATEEITGHITGIQQETTDAVGAMQSIGQIIGQINEIATGIASAVEEQGAATQEISRNVQQAAAGTQDVSTNIAGVNQAASETGAAAGQVLTAAKELSRQGGALREQVNSFLSAVRAA